MLSLCLLLIYGILCRYLYDVWLISPLFILFPPVSLQLHYYLTLILLPTLPPTTCSLSNVILKHTSLMRLFLWLLSFFCFPAPLSCSGSCLLLLYGAGYP